MIYSFQIQVIIMHIDETLSRKPHDKEILNDGVIFIILFILIIFSLMLLTITEQIPFTIKS